MTTPAESKLVLVTGGARGIGEAIVTRLTRDGYRVHLTYRSSDEAARRLASELPGVERVIPLDLADPGAVAAVCDGITKEDSSYYAFVHNAATTYDALTASIEQAAAATALQVNLLAATQLLGALLRPMIRQRSGRVVFITSVAAQLGSKGNGVYAASKGGLESLARCVAAEFARKGVTANCVAPGLIDTELVKHYPDSGALLARIPARRRGTPSEVAAAVAFLLDEDAGYVNGVVLAVDGGMSAALGP